MKRLNNKTVYEGKLLSVQETVYENKEGRQFTWESIHRKRSSVGVVVVAKLNPSNRFILTHP